MEKLGCVVYDHNYQAKMAGKQKPREAMTVVATFSLRAFADPENLKF